jgi:hypothetical protein
MLNLSLAMILIYFGADLSSILFYTSDCNFVLDSKSQAAEK